jgi:alpha-L-fucosidase
MTRKLQPGANIFSDVGWDVRWVGNERGEAGETSWSTFTPMPLPGKAKAGPGENRDELNPVGTRNGNFWIPAECDVPLRKGWFFHPAENGTVKSAERLFDIYLKSVGRGGCLDLGLAPDTRGLLHENDVKALAEFGDLLRRTFSDDLARKAVLRPGNVRGGARSGYQAKNLTDGDRYTYWATDDKVTNPELVLEWKQPQTFNLVRLREDIRLGQRIAAFELDAWLDGAWTTVGKATSIGACRILKLDREVTTAKCRLRITDSPVCVALSEFGLFLK